MVRVITQETFDLVVTENMEEFEMDRAEAVKDAKEQFEQQGVSLVNIVVSEQGSQVRIFSPLTRKSTWFGLKGAYCLVPIKLKPSSFRAYTLDTELVGADLSHG